MISCERVLAALRKQPVDRVPWIEGIVGNGIASAVCGGPINVDWSVAPDGLPVMSGAELAQEQKKVNRVFGKDNINFCAFAPIFAHKMEKDPDSPVIVGDGMIRTEDDFERCFLLPSANDPGLIESAREFIANKGEYCAVAAIRLGIGATLLSMGVEGFSYAMADNPELIRAVHTGYAQWTGRVVAILEEIGFDLLWAFDDVAFNSGPVFSPEYYETDILPTEKTVTSAFSLPLITHSDGQMMPLLDSWTKLGQQAIHPIQPDVMDIYHVREILPDGVGIVGNIDMDLLVNGSQEDVARLVNERLQRLGPTENYIISSSNSLTDNMKPENIWAMIDAINGKPVSSGRQS